ncbi:hypothetical protein [Lentimicrobium sp.]|uniref:hypothetical protein n=2 Tax=Lentimicrobium sp. TaxID=2034841 RepID=UPI002B79FC4F|nr:hypothetical protein [Lentimicrobium sp.]HPF65823.1 hypothetical protein [Lentimicrobium sp.]HPR27365.1 hypothetical protein [Lentimicrobium sp.]
MVTGAAVGGVAVAVTGKQRRKQAGEIMRKVPDADELSVYYMPFDVGAKEMAGYEPPAGFQLILNDSFGIADIEPDINGGKPESDIKNMGFGL